MTDLSIHTPAGTAPARILDAEAGPAGECFDIGGRRLWLRRAGAEGPTVVFLPGAGLVGLDYLNIQEAIVGFATAVLYDRAGTGWSAAARLPRPAAEVVDELHALLAAAGAPAPYLLVGHSLGGAYARRFAQRYPDEVAAILYLDPAHEDFYDAAPAPKLSLPEQLRGALALARAALNMKRFYRPLFEAMYAAWPAQTRRRLVDYHLGAWRKSLDEGRNLKGEICEELRAGGPLPDVPVIVLTAMGIDPFMAAFAPEAYLRALNAGKVGLYDALAASVTLGENRLLPDAGHSTLHTDRPDAVIAAIRDLIERTRH